MEVQIFTAPGGQEIRAFEIDGEPWFTAHEVCAALEVGNASQAIARLDDDEHTLISNDGMGAAKTPQIRVVSESGLYSLTLGSRKPEAKKFKRWITHDVLPSIRKTGSYTVEKAGIRAVEPKQYTILDYARELIASHDREAAKELENKVLLVELDRSKEYASIKRMEKLWKRKFAWQKLKAQSTEAGIEIKQVFDQNYGNVNAYREDVWMEVYGIAVTKEKL